MHIKPKYNCLRCNPNSFVKSNHIFVISKKNPLSHAYVCVRLLCIFFIWSFVIAPNQFEGAMNMNMHHAAIWIFLSIVFLKQTIFFLVSVRCSSNAHRFCSAKIYLYFIIFHLNGIFHLIFLRLHKRYGKNPFNLFFVGVVVVVVNQRVGGSDSFLGIGRFECVFAAMYAYQTCNARVCVIIMYRLHTYAEWLKSVNAPNVTNRIKISIFFARSHIIIFKLGPFFYGPAIELSRAACVSNSSLVVRLNFCSVHFFSLFVLYIQFLVIICLKFNEKTDVEETENAHKKTCG